MPSVADELAELRKRSLTTKNAAKLQDANGLSTPEQEEEALKETQKTRKTEYKKDAVETLNAGSNAVDQDMALRVQQIAQKKEDQMKQREASNLNKAGTKAVDKQLDFEAQQNAEKKDNMEKKKQATENLQTFNEAKLQVESPTKDSKAVATEPALEEIPDMDDAIPELEAVSADSPAAAMPEVMPSVAAPRVQNRAEKKARKMMERLGMKPVAGVSRVTLKMRGNQGFFTIFQPDVFEKSGSYIVFGEARQGAGLPGAQDQQAQAAQQLATPVVEEKKATESTQEEAVDETGVDAKDIELVISQAGCSRARAVEALKSNDGDLVNAIMSLTS